MACRREYRENMIYPSNFSIWFENDVLFNTMQTRSCQFRVSQRQNTIIYIQKGGRPGLRPPSPIISPFCVFKKECKNKLDQHYHLIESDAKKSTTKQVRCLKIFGHFNFNLPRSINRCPKPIETPKTTQKPDWVCSYFAQNEYILVRLG